jgi:hypothetical protein
VGCLEKLGLTKEKLMQLKEWAERRSVVLRFKAEERCSLKRKEEREVDTPVLETLTTRAQGSTETRQWVKTKLVEYFWDFEAEFTLLAFPGNDPLVSVPLFQEKGSVELTTPSALSPRPPVLGTNTISLWGGT